MAYVPLDIAVPTTAQTRQDAIDAIRTNVAALRDLIVATGVAQGFNYSVVGGTASQPASLVYTKGTEIIRVDLTWGTTGGEAGNVVEMAFYYSPDSGGTTDGMIDDDGNYAVVIAYDVDGNVTTTTWTDTP